MSGARFWPFRRLIAWISSAELKLGERLEIGTLKFDV